MAGLGLSLSSSMRAKVACILLLSAWAYAAWPSLLGMVKTYKNSGFDYHGFLVLPLCFFLMQQQRAVLHRTKLCTSTIALLCLMLCCALWLVAAITRLTIIEQAALISMVPAIIYTSCGFKVTRILVYPFMCLFLLVPIGQQIYDYLQQFFAWGLVNALALTNLSIYWEDQTLYIAKQQYALPQICAALKFTTLYLTLGLGYAAIFNRTFITRLITALAFVTLPIVFLFMTILSLMLYSAWQALSNFAATTILLISWGSITAGIFVAMYLGFKLRTNVKNNYKNDGIDWRNEFSHIGTRWLTPTITAAILLLILPTAAQEVRKQQHAASGWHDSAKLAMIKAQTKSQDVALQIDHNNIYKQEIPYDPKTWQQIKNTKVKTAVNNKVIPVTESLVINKYNGKIIWSVYYANGHLTNSPTYTKVLENVYALTTPGAKTAHITLSTDIDQNINTSRKRLSKSLNDLERVASSTWSQG